MALFKKKTRHGDAAPAPSGGDDLVRKYLRGQNLEQVGRTDDAIELYEQAVAAQFDSSGPYDRLIFIYEGRRRHGDVIRVANAALESVRTYPQKQAWYRSAADKAQNALDSPPKPL